MLKRGWVFQLDKKICGEISNMLYIHNKNTLPLWVIECRLMGNICHFITLKWNIQHNKVCQKWRVWIISESTLFLPSFWSHYIFFWTCCCQRGEPTKSVRGQIIIAPTVGTFVESDVAHSYDPFAWEKRNVWKCSCMRPIINPFTPHERHNIIWLPYGYSRVVTFLFYAWNKNFSSLCREKGAICMGLNKTGCRSWSKKYFRVCFTYTAPRIYC